MVPFLISCHVFPETANIIIIHTFRCDYSGWERELGLEVVNLWVSHPPAYSPQLRVSHGLWNISLYTCVYQKLMIEL